MDYRNEGRSAVASAGTLSGPVPGKARALDGLMTELEQRLESIAEGVRRTSEFKHRLINPRPADETGAGKEPANPITLESRIAMAVRRAEALGYELNGIAGELESAI